MRSIAAGEAAVEPEASVGAEVLLRREVVDVGGRGVEVDAAGGTGCVDDRESIAGCALDRVHDTGGRLVVGVGDDIDAVDCLECGAGAWLALRGARLVEPGSGSRGRRELAAELAEDLVVRAALDEAEDCGVPE